MATLIAQGAKYDRTKSVTTLDGTLPEDRSLYGGKFGPSVIAALKKSPDVQSVVRNALLQVDSPIPVTHLVKLIYSCPGVLRVSIPKARTVTAAIAPEDATRNLAIRIWPFKNIRNAGKNVNVYIIDTGVSNHSDLTGRFTRRPRANVAVVVDSPDADNTNDAQSHGRNHRREIPELSLNSDIMAGLVFAVNDSKGKGAVINI
ncbi:hypothetical protein B0H19DRAFT_1231125 [Mycena capillaripes]|nr:hypothetical protein B0H19DRAFT_1231125 [Mycena capillaripes]